MNSSCAAIKTVNFSATSALLCGKTLSSVEHDKERHFAPAALRRLRRLAYHI